jgi:hypothetical protein
MKTMQLPTDDLVQPAEKCQDSIIFLQHPTDPTKRYKLLRGGIEKTLRRFGYIEITKEEYESEDVWA